MLKRWIALAGLAATCCLAAGVPVRVAAAQGRASGVAETRSGTGRPRLVVLISIDQFRADYLVRFRDLFLPARTGKQVGGFRYFTEAGAWYPDCQYQHHRTVTAVGHAILGTGAQPAVSGIVGNTWWDRTTKKAVYCCDDPKGQVVGLLPGSKETPMSAANLQATTYGDELELATGGRAKTVAMALKDRAAILLAGHVVDTPIWFDEQTGAWVSSTAYLPDSKLPAWVEDFNRRQIPAKLRETAWTPSSGETAMQRTWKAADGGRFSHALTGTDYLPFAGSPAGNAFVFLTAKQAVQMEGLGKDEIPDVLSINLSSNDYVGHRYGPDSPEVLDITVQTDRQLSDFLNYLEAMVPGGLANVTFSISADHGALPVPELLTGAGVYAGRAIGAAVRNAAEQALDTAVGAGDWIVSTENGDLYFNDETAARFPQTSRERLEEIAAAAVQSVPGVFFGIGKSAVLAGRVPANALGRRLSQGVHPRRTGDVIVILDPGWLPGSAPTGTGTSHGSPFTYDTHVPLIMAGFGVKPGVYRARVSPAQLAPTLAHLLGAPRPSAADEPLLPGLTGVE